MDWDEFFLWVVIPFVLLLILGAIVFAAYKDLQSYPPEARWKMQVSKEECKIECNNFGYEFYKHIKRSCWCLTPDGTKEIYGS